MRRCAIVGFGCAGYYAAKTLRENCPDCEIDVYSDTDSPLENPILTTYYVADRIPRQEVFPFGSLEDAVKELRIHFFSEQPVTGLSGAKREIVLKDGSRHGYDDIILASGSSPLVPPIQGMPREGIYVMRTLRDADCLLQAVKDGLRSVLVIGASWVGIKVVEALHAHKVDITLADMAPYIFATAAFPQSAEIVQAYLKEQGVHMLFGAGITSMEKTPDGIVSVFGDGTRIETQAVALCMGIRPNISYVDREEFRVGRGIQVDGHMQTSVPHIYAAGDCCEAYEIVAGKDMNVSIWANAVEQAQIAARNVLGIEDSFRGSFAHNITHAMGFDFIGMGDPRLPGEVIETGSGAIDHYFRATVKDGQLQCVNILGDYRLSGSLKNWFVMQREEPGRKMPKIIRANLLREGLSEEIVRKMGGE